MQLYNVIARHSVEEEKEKELYNIDKHCVWMMMIMWTIIVVVDDDADNWRLLSINLRAVN